ADAAPARRAERALPIAAPFRVSALRVEPAQVAKRALELRFEPAGSLCAEALFVRGKTEFHGLTLIRKPASAQRPSQNVSPGARGATSGFRAASPSRARA